MTFQLKNITKYFAVFYIFSALTLIMTACTASSDKDISNQTNTGVGGSLNRFTIIGHYLYTLNGEFIETYDISEQELTFMGRTHIDEDIETVFPFDSLVLVGGANSMYICKRESSGVLTLISQYEHIRYACDPVVATGDYAYITLSSGCGNESNQLDIVNIKDPFNPQVIRSYAMDGPKGLGVDNELLFICDFPTGLTISDRSDPVELQFMMTCSHLNPVDVIPYQGLLFVMTETAIHQFDYSDPGNIYELSMFTLF